MFRVGVRVLQGLRLFGASVGLDRAVQGFIPGPKDLKRLLMGVLGGRVLQGFSDVGFLLGYQVLGLGIRVL